MNHWITPPQISELRAGHHVCGIYDGERQWAQIVQAFVQSGISRGEKILAILDEPYGQRFLPILGGQVLDVQGCLQSGQLVVYTTDEAYRRGGAFHMEQMLAFLRAQTQQAFEQGFAALRVVSEMTRAQRELAGFRRLVEYECGLSAFFATQPCLALCLYDRTQADPSLLLDVLYTHPWVAIGDEIFENRYYRASAELATPGQIFSKLNLWLDDIVAHKRAEDAVRKNEAYLKNILDSIHAGILIIDEQTHEILDANAPALRMIGIEKDQLCGNICHGYVCPAEKGKCPISDLKQTIDLSERDLLTTAGARIPILKSVAAVERDGRRYLIESFIDNTERKAYHEALRSSVQRYRSVVEDMPALVCRCRADGVLTFVNNAYCRYFKKNQDELDGKKFYEFFPDPARSIARERFEKITENPVQNPFVAYELEIDSPDGETIWQQWTERALFDAQGQLMEYQMVGQDVTERKKTEAALKKHREQLYQAQKMEALGTLVAGVAHEINNPVNLIMFNMPLLAKVWTDLLPLVGQAEQTDPIARYGGLTPAFLRENLGQLIADVNMAANRIARIVNGLKDFARKSDVAEKRPVRLNIAVTNAVRLAQTTLKKSGVRLELSLSPSLPMMQGDLHSIEQIVLNIMINAVQAIDHDHGVIRIITETMPDGWIRLSVSDNGRGVDPEIAERIFDPFITDKQADGGTGLGLSVSYSLVKVHGGMIEFDTSQGQGTTFYVKFPAVSVKPSRSVLVVDDENTVRRLICDVLKKTGRYVVEEASDGVEACIKLGAHRPDLLVLDMFMANMNGLEVCRVVKRQSELAGMKVIITTGFPEDPIVEAVRRMGFTQVVGKPLDTKVFLEIVEKTLNES